MNSIPELKLDLSMRLQDELAKRLAPNEALRISLPGGFGEAFAATDRRAMIIRERDGGIEPECDVFEYPLGAIVRAEAVASSTGGYIGLDVPDAKSEPDKARVYFPSYDLDKFKAAADLLNSLIEATAHDHHVNSMVQSSAVAPMPGTGASAASALACPKCGAGVSGDAVFCGQCGAQVRDRCASCGSSSSAGARFCEVCGRAMQVWTPDCQKCGARVQRWQTYCTECGSIQQQTCASCGAVAVEGWKYCANCGREYGTAYVNPRTTVARRMQETFRNTEQSQETAVPSVISGSTPTVEPPPEVEQVAPTASAAEQHNQRGREFFEAEDYEGAIAEFDAAVRMEPGNASYHCNLAVAYDENEQDDDALVEYEKTLSIDPNDLTALLSLGYMYNENGETEKAQAAWNRLVQIAPQSAEAQEAQESLKHQGDL